MTLKDHIEDIQNRINAGRFLNEASVSQGIVLRLLHALGWPTYDTQIVMPEYTVEGLRVDFALCQPPSKPVVFVEVKQIGQVEGAERQLFEYAFHKGVPIAVLTDGREWHFFLPSGQGAYDERRAYKLDLLEREVAESVHRLDRYLNHNSIRTGEAIEAIRKDYENVSKERQIKATLPEAWRRLVEEGDEFLLEVVADKVESLCGYKPTNQQVLSFLKSLPRTELPLTPTPLPRKGEEEPQVSPPPGRRSKTGLLIIMPNGKRISHSTAAESLVAAIEELGIERVKSLGFAVSSVPLVSTTKDSKYGQSQRKCGHYYVITHSSTKRKKAILEKIALRLGVKLAVNIIPEPSPTSQD
jgi:hypothetical protein